MVLLVAQPQVADPRLVAQWTVAQLPVVRPLVARRPAVVLRLAVQLLVA